MKNRILQISLIIVLIAGCLFIPNTSKAASFSASISKTTVTVGDTFTVTVNANNAAGMYSVTTSNSNVSVSSGAKEEFLEDGKATITFKATKAGTITIKATAKDMADLDDDTKRVTGTKTFTVTIKEKSSSGGSSNNTTTKPTFSSTNQTVYATGEVNVRSSYSTSSSRLGTLQKGDSVTRTGIANKSVDGILWSKVTYNGQTAYISSSFLTTTKPAETDDPDDDKKDDEKSTNNYLKSLNVVPNGLTPNFDRENTKYKLTVGSDIDSLRIDAIADDEKSKVSITGNDNFKLGENTVTIKVTAEDESVKNYTITVTKEEKEQLGLKELLIEGMPLTPEFDETIYEYTLNLDKANINELNITAISTREDATVEIIGNADLKNGENIIKILVRDSSGEEEEIVTYQVTVNIPEIQNTSKSFLDNILGNDTYKYIAIGIIAFIILMIIIIIIVKRRKRNQEEIDSFYGGYNLRNDVDEDNGNNIEKDESLKIEKLSEEDIPKSLRKNRESIQDEKEPIIDAEKQRKSKIDELTSENIEFEDHTNRRKKGKHF